MDHFLLLLVIVAIVQVLGLVLLIEFRTRLHALILLLTVQLRLHVGKVGLLRVRVVMVMPWVRLLLGQTALQVLTHADHARVITRRAVYLRALRTALKLIETTWSSLAGLWVAPVSVGDVAPLERLLTRIYPW